MVDRRSRAELPGADWALGEAASREGPAGPAELDRIVEAALRWTNPDAPFADQVPWLEMLGWLKPGVAAAVLDSLAPTARDREIGRAAALAGMGRRILEMVGVRLAALDPSPTREMAEARLADLLTVYHLLIASASRAPMLAGGAGDQAAAAVLLTAQELGGGAVDLAASMVAPDWPMERRVGPWREFLDAQARDGASVWALLDRIGEGIVA